MHPVSNGHEQADASAPAGLDRGQDGQRTAFDSLRRYAAVYAMLGRNSLVREMTFKTNFVLWIFVELLWFGLQITFINVMFLHTESIAGWSKWQVVLLIGTSHFIQQIFHASEDGDFRMKCLPYPRGIRSRIRNGG